MYTACSSTKTSIHKLCIKNNFFQQLEQLQIEKASLLYMLSFVNSSKQKKELFNIKLLWVILNYHSFSSETLLLSVQERRPAFHVMQVAKKSVLHSAFLALSQMS